MPLQSSKKISTVVIIGRTNVGKSYLFNRLTETNKALVSTVAGTTRDYNVGQVEWQKKKFAIIDTGGVNIENLKNSIQALLPGKKSRLILNVDIIEKEIISQTKEALEKADTILMVVDGQTGLLPEDKELALVAKKLNKPILLVCNKIDGPKFQNNVSEFFKLGLGNPMPVSAANGTGTGDLLDELSKMVKGKRGRIKKTAEPKPIRVAIIGKPNVGKSSLVNKITGQNRVIVSPVAQTTREPQDSEINYQGKKISLIDTAGLRKKARIDSGIERMASQRSVGTAKSADIILFLTDVSQPLTAQDSFLAGLIKDTKAGMILVANKWDILPDRNQKSDAEIKKNYQRYFPFLSYVPLIFISAKTGRGVDKIMDLVLEINKEKQKKVTKKNLDDLLKKIVKIHYPAQAEGSKKPHLYSLQQTKVNPPEFTIILGQDQSLHFSYLRFVQNQIRQEFTFLGVPITIRIENLRQ